MTNQELEKIYSEAYRAVYWTAFSLLKNEEDAQDIVQDTFVSLINSYDSIKDKDKILPWLKKVAANKSLNRLTRTKTDTVEDEFFDTVETVPEDFLPDSLVESAETRKIIMDIISNSLSEDIRRTLILFYFDEMSIKEISEALGIPEGTVSWRIHSAKKKIKKEVEKYEEENDTKLFMVVPFLTQLFTKEAEQVPFRPMPEALLNLSASTKAAETAGSKLAKEAVKKGTEIMLKKIIISSVAIVLVGATTAGIVYFATRKNEDTGSKDPTTKITENEISAIAPDEESTTTAPKETESTDKTATEATNNTRLTDKAHIYLYGKEIKLGVYGSTMQDLADAGCYCVFEGFDVVNTENKYYTLDDGYENVVSISIYPDEASAASNIGKIDIAYANGNGIDPTKTNLIKDCIVTGFRCNAESAAVWGDKLSFDFPLPTTIDLLKENLGDPDGAEENRYTYMSEFNYWDFTFDENGQLTYVLFH